MVSITQGRVLVLRNLREHEVTVEVGRSFVWRNAIPSLKDVEAELGTSSSNLLAKVVYSI